MVDATQENSNGDSLAALTVGALAGLVIVLVAWFAGVMWSNWTYDDQYSSEVTLCLEPLRESWEAGEPRWDILHSCEHRSGRYGGWRGDDSRAREWKLWEGRERAWIVAQSNLNSNSFVEHQAEIKQMINEAVAEAMRWE